MKSMRTRRTCGHGRTRTTWLAGIVIAVAAPLLGPAPAAQDLPQDLTELPLEHLMKIGTVQGASRYAQKVTEAPASISIITAEEIRRHGYQTLAEALAGVRGFYTTYDRNYTYLGLRGFSRPSDYNSRVLILIDGHRVNESIYGSAYVGTEQLLDMEMIETIEVIRGPGSSLYGSSAFLAVVNVITRKARDLRGTELSGLGASYGTAVARGAYGRAFGEKRELVLSGSGYRSGGQDLHFDEYDDPANNNGVADGVDGDSYYRGFAKLRLGDFGLAGAFSWREKEIPTGAYATTFNDGRNRTFDQRSYLDVAYRRAAGGRTSVHAHAYYDNYYYRGDYFYSPDQYRERVNAYWMGLEGTVSVQVSKRNLITVGGEFRDHPKLSNRSGYTDFPPSAYIRRASRDGGVFVQAEIEAADRLTVNVGLRYDEYDSFGSSINPRLAVIFRPSKNSSLKALYGEAFRAPNAAELYLGTLSNPDLDPELIQRYGLVYEHYLGSRLSVSGNLFKYKISGLIGPGALVAENLETIDSEGAELEIERHWPGGAAVRFSHAFQNTHDRATGGDLSNSPAHLAKLHWAQPLRKDGRLSLGTEVLYTSERLTRAGNESDGFLLANLTLVCQARAPGIELSASVLNLLDEDYGDPAAGFLVQEVIPQNGRNYRLRFTWRF